MNRPRRVAGTTTTWWATMLVLLVLSSMLSTFLFAFPYLSEGLAVQGPDDPPPLGFAVAAAITCIASAVPVVLAHRAVGRASAAGVAGGALGAVLLGGAFVGLAVADLVAAGATPTVDAWSSTRVVVVVFHLVVAGVVLLGFTLLPLRLWRSELDRRQQALTVSLAVLWYYVVGGWLIVSAMVHAVPALR